MFPGRDQVTTQMRVPRVLELLHGFGGVPCWLRSCLLPPFCPLTEYAGRDQVPTARSTWCPGDCFRVSLQQAGEAEHEAHGGSLSRTPPGLASLVLAPGSTRPVLKISPPRFYPPPPILSQWWAFYNFPPCGWKIAFFSRFLFGDPPFLGRERPGVSGPRGTVLWSTFRSHHLMGRMPGWLVCGGGRDGRPLLPTATGSHGKTVGGWSFRHLCRFPLPMTPNSHPFFS